MANQKTPTTDTVEDYTVEKIILSGAQFVSSILGHGAHLITADSAPVFYTDPVITGLLFPPSLLSCDTGAFNSSPRAVITYQWKKDAVDITDETSNTYLTVLSDIDAAITCLVTITNASGNDTGLSNALTMLAITDTFVYTLDIMPIQGLSHIGRIDINVIDASIITGMAQTMKIDINAAEPYIISGIAAPERMDINVGEPYILSGMAIQDAISVNIGEPYVITGLSSDDAESILVSGAYPMFVPTYLTPLVVVNHDAETGDMTGWTIDDGTITAETSGVWDVTSNREGSYFFYPAPLGQGVDSQMSQVIDIPAGDWTDVDAGRCYCIVQFLHLANQTVDFMKITMQALNAADGLLATSVYDTVSIADERWVPETTCDDPLNLPTLTRKVKLIVLFSASMSGSAPNSVYADDFHIELFKIG